MVQAAPAPSITVGGNVEGSIVVGDNNFVVNTNYGTVVYKQASPQVRPRDMVPRPPRVPRGFVGRSRELSSINSSIAGREAVLIEGPEGIGKSTVVKYAANSDAARAQPNGVVFLEAIDQNGAALGRDDIIQLLFDALFESDPSLKVSFSSARTYLSNTTPLVVLDSLNLSAAAYENLLDLFPQAPILTIAEQPPGSTDFVKLRLNSLSADESALLLAERAGLDLAQADPDLVGNICGQLANVPLALTIVGNVMRENDLRLEQAHSILASIQTTSQDTIQIAIERSYRFTQSFLSPDEQKMSAYTAAVPGISADRGWLEACAGGPEVSRKLEDLGLLKANSPRLRLHPAFTRFALDGADAHNTRTQLLSFLRDELDKRGLDTGFIKDELANILGLIKWAAEEGYWQDVILLGRAADPYLTLHGLWDAGGEVLQNVLRAARTLRDMAVEAWALHQLGTMHIGLGKTQEAIDLLHKALDLRQRLGDHTGIAYTQHNLDLLVPPPPPGPPNRSLPRPTKGFLFAAGISAVLLFALGYFAMGRSASFGQVPIPDTRQPSATFTATTTASQTPTRTLTPTPKPTMTSTPTQTFTPSPAPTSSRTPTPTITLTPTFSFPTAVVLKQSTCRYGPGTAYLYADGLYPGDTVVISGRNYNGSWLFVKSDKSGRYCWISIILVQPTGDITKVNITQPILPHTTETIPPTNVQGTRKDGTVIIIWDQIHTNLRDARGYLLEVVVCQNGLRVPMIVQTDGTSYEFNDETGCSAPSSGKIYSVDTHGYSDPIVIPWP